jgi:hypothetical protein
VSYNSFLKSIEDRYQRTFNNKNFWKLWTTKFKKNISSNETIGGCSDAQIVAEKFGDNFNTVYVDSYSDTAAVNDFEQWRNKSTADKLNADLYSDIKIIEKCIATLKPCKAAGFDGIVPEHLIHSHPSIVFHLKSLFILMLKHEFVPDAFGKQIIIPIIMGVGASQKMGGQICHEWTHTLCMRNIMYMYIQGRRQDFSLGGLKVGHRLRTLFLRTFLVATSLFWEGAMFVEKAMPSRRRGRGLGRGLLAPSLLEIFK